MKKSVYMFIGLGLALANLSACSDSTSNRFNLSDRWNNYPVSMTQKHSENELE